MILFDPQNPFPLIALDQYTYQEAKEHASQADQWIGFNMEPIEDLLIKKKNPVDPDSIPTQTWAGLSVQAFQTPYIEIRSILDLLQLKTNQKIIDLGCAYGRMAHVVGFYYPEINFLGFEFSFERVVEARKCLSAFLYPNVEIKCADLSEKNFELSWADIYFMYDFGSQKAIEKTIQDLQQLALQKEICVVARGKSSRHVIHTQHPWLTEVNKPQHFEHFSIYRS